jgi:hypothetical protein
VGSELARDFPTNVKRAAPNGADVQSLFSALPQILLAAAPVLKVGKRLSNFLADSVEPSLGLFRREKDLFVTPNFSSVLLREKYWKAT